MSGIRKDAFIHTLRGVTLSAYFLFAIITNLVIQYLVTAVTGRENRLLLPLSIGVYVVLYLYDNWCNMSPWEKR